MNGTAPGGLFSAQANEHRPVRQNGVALIIVLWIIVLLGIIAMGHANNVRSETRLAMRHVASAKARNLAEAGIQRAIVSLLLQNGDSALPVNGSQQRIRINGREISIAIRDATGLVDLNAADAGLLSALLATGGGDAVEQENLVDAILDWRDADNFRHLHGAEDEDYRSARLQWSARDAAFSSVDELRYVIGMTPERFMAIAPYATVHSGRAGVNVDYAPSLLINTLSDSNIKTAEGDGTLPVDDDQPRRRIGARNGTYHIYVSASGDGNVSASIETVVNISASAEQPYAILYWREPARFPFSSKD